MKPCIFRISFECGYESVSIKFDSCLYPNSIRIGACDFKPEYGSYEETVNYEECRITQQSNGNTVEYVIPIKDGTNSYYQLLPHVQLKCIRNNKRLITVTQQYKGSMTDTEVSSSRDTSTSMYSDNLSLEIFNNADIDRVDIGRQTLSATVLLISNIHICHSRSHQKY